jgi:hypothetical protein
MIRLGWKTQDHDAFEAFRFANRAMLLRRSHTVWARQRKQDYQKAPTKPVVSGKSICIDLQGISDRTAVQ